MKFTSTWNTTRLLSQVKLPQIIGENLVEIQCLGEGDLAITNLPTMATTDALQDLIRQHASKKRRAMCSLPPKPKDLYKKCISKKIYIHYFH
jgi:hypothetical protein